MINRVNNRALEICIFLLFSFFDVGVLSFFIFLFFLFLLGCDLSHHHHFLFFRGRRVEMGKQRAKSMKNFHQRDGNQ